MSRTKHQFRPGDVEVFEKRVVPTVVAYPGGAAYNPPGLVEGGTFVHQDVVATLFTVTTDAAGTPAAPTAPTDSDDTSGGANDVPGQAYAGNFISTTLTNTNTTPGSVRYATFAVYAAEGKDFNIASQNLIYSKTYTLQPGQSLPVSVDLSTLKIPGKEKVQCEIWSADDENGYAPKKLKPGDTGYEAHLLLGELFEFEAVKGQKHS